jgi:nitroimidazol reductase NimA-like FMN-containing flavoprotein (pyridoxamine 5'-phosphate oxidase superfamily)
MARKDISMSDAEVAALLAQARNLQVATNGPGGFPHVTTLWFYVDDGLVTFRSFTKSQRVVNLLRDPKLTVLAETGTDYEELRGVMIQGIARMTTDPTDVMRTYAEVARKMQGLDEVSPDAVEALYGRFATKNTVIRVEPVKVVSWDHSKLGGGY